MRRSRTVWLVLIEAILLVCSVPASAQTCTTMTFQFPSGLSTMANGGQPISLNSISGTTACFGTDPLYLDATQFMGADICAKINAAYTALPSTPKTGGTIDARGFTGFQTCNSNPFHGANKAVTLLLGGVQIVTSVAWVTPQAPHRIVGITPSKSPTETIQSPFTLGTANATLIQACGPSSIDWQETASSTCGPDGIGTVAIGQFGQTATGGYFLPFINAQHGPFPLPGTGQNYASVITDGGINNTTEGDGWGTTALGGRVENVFLDCGGNDRCFTYYTENEQERSGLFNVGCSHIGNDSACAFWDRVGSSVGTVHSSTQPGPTHFSVHDMSMDARNTSGLTNGYGLVMEGAPILLILGAPNTGGTQAHAYVSGVTIPGGAVSAFTLVNGGSNYPSTTSCTISAENGSGATCSATVTNGVVTSVVIGGGGGGSGYPSGLLGGGPDDISDVTMAGFGQTPGETITGGIWIEGYSDAQIGYLHCEFFSADCLLFGSGNEPTHTGFIHNIDTANSNNPVVHIGFGVDASAQFRSISVNGAGTTNVIQDDQNGVVLMSPVWQYLPEYLPGGHPAPFTPYIQPHNFRNWGSITANGTSTTLNTLADAITINGSGVTATAQAATATEPPMINYSTSGAANAVAVARGNFNYLVGSNILFQAYAAAPDFAVGTTNPQRVWVGITDSSLVGTSTDTPAANFAAFRYSTITPDVTWQCVVGNGTSTTVVPSTVSVDTNGHRFEITFSDSSTPAATFKIDGNPVCTAITANYPTSGKLLGDWVSITALSSATRNVRFSYLDSYQDPRR